MCFRSPFRRCARGPADIPALARHFLRALRRRGRQAHPRPVTPEALALLGAFDWPGNVRQLENAVFRAVVLAEGDELTVAEFPQIAAHVAGFDVRIPAAPTRAPPARRANARSSASKCAIPTRCALLDESGDMRKLDELEAEAIRFALDPLSWPHVGDGAKLGIGRSTLYRKMKEYGLGDAAETQDNEETSLVA